MRHKDDGTFGCAFSAKKKKWFTANCFKFMFVVALLCSTSLLFILASKTNHIIFYRTNYKRMKLKKFTMKMNGCSIPQLDPLDESVREFVKFPKDIDQCLDPERLPLEHNQTHIWIKNKFHDRTDNGSFVCCYRAFSRPTTVPDINKDIDNLVAYNICRTFTDTIDVSDEFVRVNCSVVNSTIEQFFSFAPKKQLKVHNDIKGIPKNAYNVLVLGIDGVSRLNLYRTMPKAVQYLKNMGAVDLSGYNKVADNTFPNLIPMLLGISEAELKTTCLSHEKAKFDSCPFLWKRFKQAGYYTAFGEDSAWLGTFNYLRSGFTNTPTDYYLHTYIHEAENYVKNDEQNDFNSTTVCLNEKYLYKVLLDYVENLTDTLGSSQLFGFFWEITMTHDYLNMPMVMDEDYVNFFRKLEKSNYLNNSILFLVSDHGIRWGDIRSTKQGRLEERLPFVFILAPPSFRNNYSEAFRNLQINSNRLTTPYDLHDTLFDLINLQNIKNENILYRSRKSYGNKRNISLFLPIPINRTCEMADISDHWCTCRIGSAIAKTSKEAVEAALFLTNYLNTSVKKYPQCATLSVAKINEAVEMIVGQPDDEESGGWREYLVTVKTSPGGGVFEATLKNSSNLNWSVSGTVSRLNRYDNQSVCIQDSQLKLYCYCTSITEVT